jgi:hypothetical protein
MDRTNLFKELAVRVGGYAVVTAFGNGYTAPFDRLLVVGAEKGALDGRYAMLEENRHVRGLLDMMGPVEASDSGSMYRLFGAMNPSRRPYAKVGNPLLAAVREVNPRNGVIIVNGDGIVTEAGVDLVIPEFGDMSDICDWACDVARAEHLGYDVELAARASLMDGVYGTFVLDPLTGASIPFSEGAPIEPLVYRPDDDCSFRKPQVPIVMVRHPEPKMQAGRPRTPFSQELSPALA